MSGSSISLKTFSSPLFFNSTKMISYDFASAAALPPTSSGSMFVKAKISSICGFVVLELTSQSAIAALLSASAGILSSTDLLTVLSTGLSSVLSTPIAFSSLGPSVRNSSSCQKLFTAFVLIASLKVFSGSLKSIGTSHLIVANILLNSASSSLSRKS